MNAQATSFADLENLSDLEPTYLQAQAIAAQRESVQRHSSQRYGSYSYVPKNWQRARTVKVPATPSWASKHQDCIDKINAMASRGSGFGKSVQSYYNRNGFMAPGHVIAVRKIIADDATRTIQQPALTVVPVVAPANAIDLSKVPEGFYAVPDGDSRLKVKIQKPVAPSRWDGYTFVSDGAAYGHGTRYGMQRPNGSYEGKIQDALRIIANDPKSASQAYGRLVGRCGCCGRKLEDQKSVAMGVGPVCAANNGWL